MTHADRRLAMDEETMQMRRDEIARVTTAEERAFAVEQGQRLLSAAGMAYQQGPEAFARFTASTPGLDGVTYETWPMEAALAGLIWKTSAASWTGRSRTS